MAMFKSGQVGIVADHCKCQDLAMADEPQFSSSAARRAHQFAGFSAAVWAALPGWFHWDIALYYFTTAVLLALGVTIALKNAPPATNVSEGFVLCGPVFFAMPMAVFGTQHFLQHVSIANLIPKWVPAHAFLTYFIGTCLVAASLSIVFRKLAGLAAALVGTMFLFFEALMHIPIAVMFPHSRIAWAIVARDFCFCCGALSLAATYTTQWRTHGTHWLASAARVCIGGFIVFYGVQHLLHPELLPGVPLNQYTPAWFPGHLLWGYLTGFVYVASGVFLLIKRNERLAAKWLGLFALCVVLIFCVPYAIQQGGGIQALDVPLDTLMFSGALLCLSRGLAGKSINQENESDHRTATVVTVAS